MAQGKAEDAGGLTPAKDDNTALCHFGHRTLPIFKCVDYKTQHPLARGPLPVPGLHHPVHLPLGVPPGGGLPLVV